MKTSPKPLLAPRLIAPPPRLILPAAGLAVRYETALCDRYGRVERILQRGRNVITDWGMNNLAATNLGTGGGNPLQYLHLSDATETLKRLLPSETSITVDAADPAAVEVTSSENYFEAGDVGRVLKIAGWPELEVTGFTSATEIVARARNSEWLPGFTPQGSGPFTDVGVHYTNKATLANEFTRFNTYDTSAADNNAELNDSANDRRIHQRIYLSAEVTDSAWTVNQIGWGPNTTNTTGKANLPSPDIVPVGKRYRVVLEFFSVYTPIDLADVVLDWGAEIGSYTCAIRQERIGADSQNATAGASFNFLRPTPPSSTGNNSGWYSSAFTMESTLWFGDGGFGGWTNAERNNQDNPDGVLDASYVEGSHKTLRTVRWSETVTISEATGLYAGRRATSFPNTLFPMLTIRPNSGTISKPGGFRMDLTFPIHWTRELIN